MSLAMYAIMRTSFRGRTACANQGEVWLSQLIVFGSRCGECYVRVSFCEQHPLQPSHNHRNLNIPRHSLSTTSAVAQRCTASFNRGHLTTSHPVCQIAITPSVQKTMIRVLPLAKSVTNTPPSVSARLRLHSGNRSSNRSNTSLHTVCFFDG